MSRLDSSSQFILNTVMIKCLDSYNITYSKYIDVLKRIRMKLYIYKFSSIILRYS
jgi:hypothetical protein